MAPHIFSATRTIRLAVLTALCAGGIAGAAYLWLRPSCEADARAFAGEVRRLRDGQFSYFDGRCWTSKPAPPADTPF